MAEGEFDDIELKNRNREEEEEEFHESETKFSDRDYPENFDERSPLVKFHRVDIPDVRKDAKGMKKSITEDKKNSFRKIFDITLKKNNGKNSTELLDNTDFIRMDNGNLAILYKDKKIGEFDNKENRIDYFKKKNKINLQEFQNTLEEAKKEYEKTADLVVDEKMKNQGFESNWDSYEWDPFGMDESRFKDSIINSSIETLSDSIDELHQDMKETEMDEQDIRELNGVLNPKGETTEQKIEFLDIQADHWRQKALLETDERKEKWYKDAEKMTRLVADKIRLENDVRPEEEETVSIIQQEIEESDIGRFEKFKKWSKENLLGLSAVAISIAGILTTIIIGVRNALKSGARAVGNLGKAIANIGKNFGALISSLLNLIGSILAWGAKGITFLAKNLWILTLAITYFLKQ